MVKGKHGHRKPYVQAVFWGSGTKGGRWCCQAPEELNACWLCPSCSQASTRAERACVCGLVHQASGLLALLSQGSWNSQERLSRKRERADPLWQTGPSALFAWMTALCADVPCTSTSFYGWISGIIMMWSDQKWSMAHCHLQKSYLSEVDCTGKKLMKLNYSSENRWLLERLSINLKIRNWISLRHSCFKKIFHFCLCMAFKKQPQAIPLKVSPTEK